MKTFKTIALAVLLSALVVFTSSINTTTSVKASAIAVVEDINATLPGSPFAFTRAVYDEGTETLKLYFYDNARFTEPTRIIEINNVPESDISFYAAN
jgi:hypothetical protein